jgi:hypothetical protein
MSANGGALTQSFNSKQTGKKTAVNGFAIQQQ